MDKLRAASASSLQVTDDFLTTKGAFLNSASNHHKSQHLFSHQDQQQNQRSLQANNFCISGESGGPMKLLQRPSGQGAGNGSTIPSRSAATVTGFDEGAVGGTTSFGFGADERGGVSPLDNMADSFRPVMMLLQKPPDDSQLGNYTSPLVNQTVKILRRPTQFNETRTTDLRPKQPLKSLKQREQEYAEARLRILGSAKNPEDEK